MKFKFNKKEYELILLTISGSHLYGNATSASDFDYRGVFMESVDQKIDMLNTCKSITTETGDFEFGDYLISLGLPIERTDDIEIKELTTFTELALKNNPNIIDTLFANPDKAIYINEKGRELLENKDIFLSSKIKHTFSGYAHAQLKKINGHYKMLTRYPNVNRITKFLTECFIDAYIDFDFLTNNFSGQIAEYITGETPQKNYKSPYCFTWEQLWDYYNSKLKEADGGHIWNWDKYRKPRLIDYCHAYTLAHQKMNLDDRLMMPIKTDNDKEFICDDMGCDSIKEFIETKASFRQFSPSMLAIYTNGYGVFGREGKLKCNEPEEIGEFVCLLKIDTQNHKKDCDAIKKLWDWKAKRNEKRNVLEEKYGYDTKHASHLIRLLTKCIEILETGNYNPKLEGDELMMVQDVRAGKYSYDKVIKMAEDLDAKGAKLYNTTGLMSSPNHKAVNRLIKKLYLNSF